MRLWNEKIGGAGAFLAATLIICVACFRNMIPEGRIVAGGDFLQWMSFGRQLSNFSYTWASEALGYFQISYPHLLYYAPFHALASILKLSLSQQSFLYYFIFLYGSFLSFYLSTFCYTSGTQLRNEWRIVIALGYAFNIFTFYNFVGLWGFSPFFFLYVLIPVVFGTTYRYLTSTTHGYDALALAGLSFFLVNIPNGNLPFFVSLNVGLVLFILLVVFFGENILDRSRLYKAALLYALLLVSNAWSVVPQIPEMIYKAQHFLGTAGKTELGDWIMGQAAKFPDPFLIVNDHWFFMRFPLLLASSLALLVTVVIGTMSETELRKRRRLTAILLMYVFVIFLMNKGNGFLPRWLSLALFENSILGALRSFHKTIIFIPYTLFLSLTLTVGGRGRVVKLIQAITIMAVVIPIGYFLRGGILTVYSYNYAEGADYRTSKVTPLVKMPGEYFSAAARLNKDISTHRVLIAPYSLIDSEVGWNLIPGLNYLGSSDPIWQLFNASVVQMNDMSSLDGWKFGKVWNEQDESDSRWLVQLAGMANVKYVLLHKDVEGRFYTTAARKFILYGRLGELKRIESNGHFDVYRVSESLYRERVYSPHRMVILDHAIDGIPFSLIESAKDGVDGFVVKARSGKEDWRHSEFLGMAQRRPTVEFKKVDPTKYRVRVYGARGSFPLIVSEAFRDSWNLYLKRSQLTRGEAPPIKGHDRPKGKQFFDQADAKNRVERNGGNGTGGPNVGSSENPGLPDGEFYETWKQMPLVSGAKHFVANGYANGWIINADEICRQQTACNTDKNGGYDIEFIVEYGPQRVFYISAAVSSMTFLACLVYLSVALVGRLRRPRTSKR